ncbi:hypothetical protein KA012_03375 [Candidatus Woesebacteria bacterium]|nr:hypothetical protein [Candidatus Woesebacteria bacterium]
MKKKQIAGKRTPFPIVRTMLALAGLIGAIALVGISQGLYTKAAYQPATLQVDVSKVLGPLPRPWANLAQGGEDHNWRLKSLIPQLKPLRPEYIRLDHVFDFYDIVSGTSGNLQFDFSKFDLLLDDIDEVGAKPYIALSYMPAYLTKDNETVGEPLSYGDWQEMVRQMVQHVSGTRAINNVYYEVWNEPDLFGKWHYGGKKNYLDLYAAAARGAAAANVNTNYKLGGPATTALYKNWIQSLATFTQSNNIRLDFISWHRYTTDLNQFRQDATDVRLWLVNTPNVQQNAEFHITEWGHDSDLNDGYDTSYGAAHTAAAAIDMIGVIERAFVFEIQDGNSPEGKAYWGRWGLFTHESVGGKPKPRFRALQLLNQLGPQRVELLGSGTYVKAVATTNDAETVQIALANFDPKGQNVENVPVTLLGLEPGTYSVKMNFLNRAPSVSTLTVAEIPAVFSVSMGTQEVAIVTITRQ